MNFSYDYEELIDEIKNDLGTGLIKTTDQLKIVRSKEKAYLDYYPIIDYYYPDDKPNEPFHLMTGKEVLEEMEFQNEIL